MSAQASEIITAPYTIWVAPEQTEFPSIDAEPAAPWVKLGTNGAHNYAEEGVRVIHSRSYEESRPAGMLAAAFSFLSRERLAVRVTLLDLTLEQLAHALGNNAVTEQLASGGIAGFKSIGLSQRLRRSTVVSLLVRGASPYLADGNAQFELPRCYEAGNAETVFRRGQPAGVALEFRSLVDGAAISDEMKFGRYLAQNALALPGSIPPALSPGPAFDGSPGSGSATVPEDPERTTAKPTGHFITPPHLTITGELLVGVIAFANNNGSLIGGIARVRFFFEGAFVDVTEPSFQTFTRFDGSTYTLFGYWLRATKGSQLGEASIFAEVVPAAAGIQSRVIGPHNLVLRDTEFEYDITMDPSQPEVAGQNYQTLLAAFHYLRSVNAETARITGSGSSVDVSGFVNFLHFEPVGRIVIEWSEPVTIGATLAGFGEWEINVGKLHWRGANITFDFEYFTNFGSRTGYSQPLFERVRFTNSAGFTPELPMKGPPPVAFRFEDVGEDGCWFAECAFDYLLNPTEQRAELVRGSIFENVANDLFTGAKAVVSNVIDGYDTSSFRAEIDAIAINGPAGATIAISGGNDANTRVVTAKEGGIEVGTFTVGKTSAFRGGNQFNNSNVVDWLNSLSGWSATLLDDTRRATSLGLANTNGAAFGDTDVSSGLTLVSQFDLHPDWIQGVISSSAVLENRVFYGNETWGSEAQLVFLTNGEYRDIAIVNNAFHQNDGSGYLSQLDSSQRHFMMVHNTFAGQRVLLRDGYNDDALTLIAANVFDDGGAEAAVTLNGTYKDNHYTAGSNTLPGDVGSSIGGTPATLLASAATGDFNPQAQLLANLKSPVFAFDLTGLVRASAAPAGAVTTSA
ncbi:MAG: hypothetical protein AAF494_01665 [Pseudomonadota bacterium]